MKKLGLLLLLAGLLFGCSNSIANTPSGDPNDKQGQEKGEIEKEIEKAKSENEFLKEKIENFSSDINNLDHRSRNIAEFIEKDELEKIKTMYGIDIDISGKNIIIEGRDNVSNYTTDLASIPMHFAYYNPQPDSLEIGYHIYDDAEGQEYKRTISLYYDLDYNLTSIFVEE